MITIDNIPKIPVKELIKEMQIDSATISLIDFKDLIVVNPNFTYFDVMSRLLRQALEKFERVCPLFKRSKLLMDDESYTFTDTFDAFINGTITEEFTNIIPKNIYNIDMSLLHTRRSWRYDRPVMYGTHKLGLQWVDYMCSYPIRVYEDKDTNDFTDDSFIYYIPLNDGNTQERMFKKQFYFQVLSYLRQIKNNLRYPDMPIELMQGIDEDYQMVQQELQEFYRRASSHGKLYR
jgi:hypothetical protein